MIYDEDVREVIGRCKRNKVDGKGYKLKWEGKLVKGLDGGM